VLAIDGKTVRGATKKSDPKTKVHIVNAVCNSVILGVKKVFEKSNEITAIPEILAELAKINLVAGFIVTTDAMGCQI
jgi:hypothetical protein